MLTHDENAVLDVRDIQPRSVPSSAVAYSERAIIEQNGCHRRVVRGDAFGTTAIDRIRQMSIVRWGPCEK